jgi:hypothetical protein
MINVSYLCSGIQNLGKMMKESVNIDSKKMNYYRLSSGFKDANNSFLKYNESYISKIV